MKLLSTLSIPFLKPTCSTRFFESMSSVLLDAITTSLLPFFSYFSLIRATLSIAFSVSCVFLNKPPCNVSVNLDSISSTAASSPIFSSILSNLSTVSDVFSVTLCVSIKSSACCVSPPVATISTYFLISSGDIAAPNPLDTSLMLSKATKALSIA